MMNFYKPPKSYRRHIFALVAVVVMGILTVVVLDSDRAQAVPQWFASISARQVEVQSTVLPTPTWTIQEKISEARSLLSNVKLPVGTKQIEYSESRVAYRSDGTTSTLDKDFKDYEREIALAVLNINTGELRTIIIKKVGVKLVAPDGWTINVLERPSGIQWNYWNTAFQIVQPVHYIVIANVYPEDTLVTVRKKQGNKTIYVKEQSIENYFYTPYSPDIHTPGLIQAGKDYTHNLVLEAFKDLKAKKVPSHAVSNGLVSDVWLDHHDFFERIPLLEQSDQTEFAIDPGKTTERVFVIIGANSDYAFSHVCNSSSACGWLQFTPPTYNQIAKIYSSAKLIKDFDSGARDHLNSMEAAILLYDNNLAGLVNSRGASVFKDPRLEEYLAASYNGSPSRATKSLAASILQRLEDWVDALSSKGGGLASETRGYLVKLRYLQEQHIPH